MQKYISFMTCLSCLLLLMTACEESDIVETEKREHPLFRYFDMGTANYGDIVKHDLLNGDFGHYYTYSATAAENVSFVLEWHERESVGLGVDLWVKNSSGQIIAEDFSLSATKAHVDVIFPEAGTYRIFVSHYFWGWFGRYPYRFGTEPSLCADITMSSTLPDYLGTTFYGVNNFAPGERDAWTWFPEISEEAAATMVVLQRNVTLGHCEDILDFSCVSGEPQVCGITFTGGDLYDNECAFRTDMNSYAGEDSSAFGWYSEYPECANQ